MIEIWANASHGGQGDGLAGHDDPQRCTTGEPLGFPLV